MNWKIFILTLLLGIQYGLFGQLTLERTKNIGGKYGESFYDAEPTEDGGLILMSLSGNGRKSLAFRRRL